MKGKKPILEIHPFSTGHHGWVNIDLRHPNDLFKDVLAVPGALPKVEQAVETNTAEAKSLRGFDVEKEGLSKCTSKNDSPEI